MPLRDSSRIVVVGGGIAGFAAALSARRVQGDAEITVVSRSPSPEYFRSSLPYVVAGEITEPQKLIAHEKVYYEDNFNINVNLSTEARRIHLSKRNLETCSLGESKTHRLPFDRLILASGSKPVVPPVEGIGLEGVFTLDSISDAVTLHQYAEKCHSAVVVGAGLVGLETAESLTKLGVSTEILDPLGALGRYLDPDMAKAVEERLATSGTKVYREEVLRINGRIHVSSVQTERQRIPCECVVVCVGTSPRVELATTSGLAVGASGGIRVNRRMQTSNPRILAAGDCAEVYNLVTGTGFICGTATAAMIQGNVAGANAAGKVVRTKGFVKNLVTMAYGTQAGLAGISTSEARGLKMPIMSKTVEGLDRDSYIPGGVIERVKLLAEARSGRLMGGQVVVRENVAPRINLLMLALQNRMHVDALAGLINCYMPRVAPVWDTVITAAQLLNKELA